MTDSTLERGEQRTINNIPTTMHGKCPKCKRQHTFTLKQEMLVPDGLQAKSGVSNDACPLYEAECPSTKYGLIQTTDIIMNTDWDSDD